MDSGPETTPQEATTRTRRSVQQHELLIGMLVLSAAFVFGSISVASGLRSRNELPKTHQVTVTGSAEQAVTADTFEWDAAVASTRPTTSAALAQINGWTAQIRTALVDAGANDGEITFGTLQVQPNVQQTGAVPTFTESETITVRSSRLPAMEGVSGVGSLLLASNVPFIAQEPKFTFSGLKQLRPPLTAQATEDARRRAQAAVGGTGRLGKLMSISVGQFSVDAPGSVNIGSGDFYTGSMQQVVSVAVTAAYSIPS